jgi:hypothetical protein
LPVHQSLPPSSLILRYIICAIEIASLNSVWTNQSFFPSGIYSKRFVHKSSVFVCVHILFVCAPFCNLHDLITLTKKVYAESVNHKVPGYVIFSVVRFWGTVVVISENNVSTYIFKYASFRSQAQEENSAEKNYIHCLSEQANCQCSLLRYLAHSEQRLL